MKQSDVNQAISDACIQYRYETSGISREEFQIILTRETFISIQISLTEATRLLNTLAKPPKQFKDWSFRRLNTIKICEHRLN